MPQKHDDATAAQKVITLYTLLLYSGTRHTLAQLAQKMNCSKQTIIRLVQTIESQGDVIEEGFEGRERWYKLKTPARKPVTTLTPQEIQRLVLCRDMVLHLLPKKVAGEIDKAIQAATALLDDFSVRDKALESVGTGAVKGMIDYTPFAGIIETLEKAIRDKRMCRISYSAVGAKASREHAFAPLGFVSYRESLYVRGVKTSDERPFNEIGPMLLAVHRFKSAGATPYPHKFKVEKVDAVQAFGIAQGDPFRVKVRFDALASTYVSERVWSSGQKISSTRDGGVILDFVAASEEEVISWVLSFGDRAVLLAPKSLRKEIVTRLEAMNRMYHPD